jgi:putative salt-induced outer membrane protein
MNIKYIVATALLATTATPVLAQDFTSGWTGSITAGADYANGNTNKTNFRSGFSIKQELERWENTAELKTRFGKENGSRTEETYRAKGEIDYKYTDTTYSFVEAEYVNDQFSGYEYRITESVGLGHKLVDLPHYRLDVKGSVGARHTKEDTAVGNKETEIVFKPEITLSWDITDTLKFGQTLSSVIGTDKTITEAGTTLSTHLIGNLALELSFDVEHTSKVPTGNQKTDTYTSLNLVYDF